MCILSVLTITDLIEIAGIIISLVTGIVAIVISVLTLKQNSRMIEESSRPYVVVYSTVTNFQEPFYYLVIKNFGQTGALITNFEVNHDLSNFSYSKEHVPFSRLKNSFLAPGQSLCCSLDKSKLFENPVTLDFSIEYSANKKKYAETFSIDARLHSGQLHTRACTKDKELRNISYTLQEMAERML